MEANKKGAKRTNEIIHAKKDDWGRSIHAVKAVTAAHKEKDELGRSVNAVKAGKAGHEEKDDRGKSVSAMKAGKKGGLSAHENKDELGRSTNGVKAAETMNAQKWEDPDHPELGTHHSGNLVRIQKRRGYPHGKENRVKAG